MSFYKQLFKLSIPLIMAGWISYGIGVCDNLMLSGLGDASVGAVYAGVQIQNLVIIVSVGIDAAILLLASQYSGKGEKDVVLGVARFGLIVSSIFGLAVSILCFFFPSWVLSVFSDKEEIISLGATYLKALSPSFVPLCISGALTALLKSLKLTKFPFYSSLFALILKIVLNMWLIPLELFGSEAVSCAIATVIIRILEMAILAVFFFITVRKQIYGKSSRRKKYVDKGVAYSFFKYGSPLILSQIVWAVNTVFSTSVMGKYAEGLLSAVGIANTANILLQASNAGVAGAVAIIVGRQIGGKNSCELDEISKKSQIIFLLSGALVGGVMLLFKEPFISLYSVSEESSVLAESLITFLAFYAPITAYQAACFLGLIKSGGNVWFVFFAEFISVVALIIPASLIGIFLGATPFFLYVLLKLDSIPKSVCAFLKLRGRWAKNITH